MKLNFHGFEVTLIPSGALFIHELSLLVLADLHLGKGVLLKQSSTPLIDNIDDKTYEKLKIDLKFFKPKLCIFCGDLIHSMTNYMDDYLSLFEKKLLNFNTKFILVKGNHDSQKLESIFKRINVVDTYELSGISFLHYPDCSKVNIAGHVHPGIKINKGRFSRYHKAFLVDHHSIICPSYGAYEGAFTKFNRHKSIYYIDGAIIKKL